MEPYSSYSAYCQCHPRIYRYYGTPFSWDCANYFRYSSDIIRSDCLHSHLQRQELGAADSFLVTRESRS